MVAMISQSEHIKQIGQARFDRVYGIAMRRIRQEPKLVGLDKIRNDIAREAALRVTGYPASPYFLSKRCGEATQEIVDLATRLVDEAAEAARC